MMASYSKLVPRNDNGGYTIFVFGSQITNKLRMLGMLGIDFSHPTALEEAHILSVRTEV